MCAEIVSFDLITLRLHTHEERRVSCLDDIKSAFISTILAINMIRYNAFKTFFSPSTKIAIHNLVATSSHDIVPLSALVHM